MRRMRRIGSISAPTFSSRPRMKPVGGGDDQSECLGLRDDKRRTGFRLGVAQQVFPQVVVVLLLGKLDGLPGSDLRSAHLSRPGQAHGRTRCTSPSRSMMRLSARLLSPIRPRRNTISGTRSRASQILYACVPFDWDQRHAVKQGQKGRRTDPLEVVVVARAQKVDELVLVVFGVQVDLQVRVVEREVRILVEERVEVLEQEAPLVLQLRDDAGYLRGAVTVSPDDSRQE